MRVPTPHYRYILGLALIAICFLGWQLASAQGTQQTIASKEAANPPAAPDGNAFNQAAVDPASDPQQTPNPTVYKPKRCDISQPQT